ncbi:MAG: hypothetical protein LLG00_02740 [Planctomycetaceae bacterium]|nr:hypothetical protein [Planctomycetaceae bacterium]
MAESVEPTPEESINLKDPAMAGVLAWLVPGLGHLYQGRRAKAALYFVAIMGLFVFGVYLGGGAKYSDINGHERHTGYGRAVYFAWVPSDKRWNYFCQVGAGMVALPALVQTARMSHHREVFWGGFMAPPWPSEGARENAGPNDANAAQPTRAELDRWLARRFELAGVFCMIAGLLNILAIYDACAGPVPPAKKEDDKEAK